MESVRGACLTTMTTQISINVNKVAITVYRDLCVSVSYVIQKWPRRNNVLIYRKEESIIEKEKQFYLEKINFCIINFL